jgi:hypothetical protein
MGRIPTNFMESTRWLDAYMQKYVDSDAKQKPVPPFAPCAVVPPQNVEKSSAYHVVPFTELDGDRAFGGAYMLTGGVSGRENFQGTFADVMEGVCVNGPTAIHPGGYGRITRDWPAVAMCGDDTLTLKELTEGGYTLIPEIGTNGVAERFGRYQTAPPIATFGELVFDGSSGFYRRVDAVRGFRILRVVDDNAVKQGLCWVIPNAPQMPGFEFAISSPLDAVALDGDAGYFPLFNNAASASFGAFGIDSTDRILNATEDVTGSGVGELWFRHGGIFDFRMSFIFRIQSTVSPSATVPTASLGITIADASDPEYASVSSDVTGERDDGGEEFGPITGVSLAGAAQTFSAPITGITGGYTDPKFQFAPSYQMMHLHTRIRVGVSKRGFSRELNEFAKMRLVWSKFGDEELEIIPWRSSGLIRLVVDRSLPTDFAEDE